MERLDPGNAAGTTDSAGSFDPAIPILEANRLGEQARLDPSNKRISASYILATIRKLSMASGLDSVTVRDIAKHSGYSIQTLYNLFGSRDFAVYESVREYHQFVSFGDSLDVSASGALFDLVDRWIESIRDAPDLQRHIGQMYFNGHRKLFYDLREYSVRIMAKMFCHQKSIGLMDGGVHETELADRMVRFSGSLILDWSDDRVDLDSARNQINECFRDLTQNKYTPSSHPS